MKLPILEVTHQAKEQSGVLALVKRAASLIVPPDQAESLYDPAVIEGLLREGEVGIMAGAAKAKKTFLLMDLVRCVATEEHFLDAFPCRQGRVLMVDLELPENALRARLSRMIAPEAAERVDVLNLRDKPELACIEKIEAVLGSAVERGEPYALCTIDCLYALADMPTDENDNAGLGDAIRLIQGAATRTRTAILVPHHTGKGAGKDRDLVDRGRGASSQAGVADMYCSIVRDSDGDALQFEGVTRNFADPDPRVRVIEFDTSSHPWRFIDTGRAPTTKKTGAKPKVAKEDVLDALAKGEVTMDELVERLKAHGIDTSATAVRRVLDDLGDAVTKGLRPRPTGKKRGPKQQHTYRVPDTSPI